jgi:hypothetical protein
VRLDVNRIGLNQSHDLVGLLLQCERPNESQSFVLQKADALDSMNCHFRAVVGLDKGSVL